LRTGRVPVTTPPLKTPFSMPRPLFPTTAVALALQAKLSLGSAGAVFDEVEVVK